MSESERRLAAIMFTDVVGFTSLGQTNEALALQLLEEHRALVRPIIGSFHGREVKTIGDAFLVEFGSALDAVQCAVEIQQAMNRRNSSLLEGRRLQIRIGIHVGDVVHSQGDILGDTVNVSSRIEPLADPGGVCISGQVYDHVSNKVAFPMEKLEGRTLKNVRVPVQVYRVVMPWDMRTEQEAELDQRRVAVLPLKNMSPDPNDEYFADGMTEELITALSAVTELTVIARTSVMQYKNAPKRVADVGRELAVGTVIEGSVRKAANKVRITVQMINAKDEGHLWAQNYDKQLDDVFTVQSEVAEKVAGALKVKLLKSEVQKLEGRAATDPEAHNEYLKGLFYWNKRTEDGLKRAVDFFQKTVERDPASPLGYTGLTLAYFIIASNYYDEPDVYFPKAKEFALKALSIDERLAEPHAVLGAIASSYDRDWDRAESEFRRAIELNPSYPSAHQWYGQFLGVLNRMQDALKEVNRALELSPLSLIINTNVADGHFWLGEYDRGIEQARRVIDMDPGFPPAYATLAYNLCRAGRFQEAEKAVEAYAKLTSPADGKSMRAYLAAKRGDVDLARKLLVELVDPSLEGHTSLYLVGANYITIGDYDRGFELIEKAVDARDRYSTYMGIDYDLDAVRGDPRYLRLLEKVGLAGRLAVRS